jgi:hypothetical protein
MSKITIILLISIVLSACSGMRANTPLPEPVGTPTSRSSTACSAPTNWTIQYNRSGGFAGFNQSITLDSSGNLTVKSERPPADMQETISDDQVKAISKLLGQACPFEMDSSKDSCADCFIYDLNIQMDGQTYTVHASDVTLTEELQPLISALDQLLQNAGQ